MAWKFSRVAKMRTRPSAIRAYGQYVEHRENEQGLKAEQEMHGPENEIEQEAPEITADLESERDQREPELEAFEDWASHKVEAEEHLYTVMMNPGEGRVSEEQMVEWTRRTLEQVQEHGEALEYRFWVHHDTEHSHVHAVMSSRQELPEELEHDFRFHAGQAWEEVELEFEERPKVELETPEVRAESEPELKTDVRVRQPEVQPQVMLEQEGPDVDDDWF